VEGNARLTGSTAAVLFVLLAAEGVTVLSVRSLLTPHVFIGMMLVPPVLLKMSTTLWRFIRYYLGAPAYRTKGPPAAALRLIGPIVVLLTIVVFASGIALLLGPPSWRPDMLLLHKASFIVWLVIMAIHVLGHVVDTAKLAPQDWIRRTRRQVAGAGVRQWTLAASVVIGLVIAVIVAPRVGPWLITGYPGHR
jgi:hypothetical protein